MAICRLFCPVAVRFVMEVLVNVTDAVPFVTTTPNAPSVPSPDRSIRKYPVGALVPKAMVQLLVSVPLVTRKNGIMACAALIV